MKSPSICASVAARRTAISRACCSCFSLAIDLERCLPDASWPPPSGSSTDCCTPIVSSDSLARVVTSLQTFSTSACSLSTICSKALDACPRCADCSSRNVSICIGENDAFVRSSCSRAISRVFSPVRSSWHSALISSSVEQKAGFARKRRRHSFLRCATYSL